MDSPALPLAGVLGSDSLRQAGYWFTLEHIILMETHLVDGCT